MYFMAESSRTGRCKVEAHRQTSFDLTKGGSYVKTSCSRFFHIPVLVSCTALERIVKEEREECRVENAGVHITADDGIDRCAA
jgi:hypothetical protein